MPASLVSLVLLHCNKAAYSRACLSSLLLSSHRPLQVVNVDNGSRDETPQVLEEWESQAHQAGIEARRLTFETNIGAIEGRNRAMEQCSGEYIGFLDNDTLLAQRNWIEVLLAFLDQIPSAASSRRCCSSLRSLRC
jgi:glycosyltransferase involved in cell wall biosynthesis